MLTLLVIQGPDNGRRFELPDVMTPIGRESRALPLTDNTVSRRHAEMIPSDSGDWTLKDLGSSNGTYVNGVRVKDSVGLKPGDQLRVGRTIMVVGIQPGVTRIGGGNVQLAGEESGMDSAIMHSIPSNDDSVVLAMPDPAAAAIANLKILYELGASLGTSMSIDQMLEVVMDLVFEHVKADRGIILLMDEHANELVPKVVRVRDETGEKPAADNAAPAPPPEIQASRTIINHVMNSGEGVLSSNAMADKRFSKGKSVHNMGIRSALCVPITLKRMDVKGEDKVVGVIYVDSSVKNYTYSPDQLRLLNAIGLQAGMVIQNARLYGIALQAERLSAIGETVAALSHSIKNILQALRGGADVVEMGFRNNNLPQANKGWRIVDRNLDKIFSLTMNLLAYSRPREPSMQAVNPRTLVNDCVELMAAQANERGVMVVADVEKDMPAVPLDPDGMHQVLMNLLSNALDAVMPNEGLVRVRCRYQEEQSMLYLDVIDNGSGIAPALMRHMFELFHSTKGNRGTGLGLAVAKKIVNEHDGTIEARSNVGEGTTFSIKIPADTRLLGDPSQTHGPR